MATAAIKLKNLAPWKKSYDQPRQHIKKQRYYFADKGLSSESYGFSIHTSYIICIHTSYVWMWELDHKEGRVPKNWYFWTVVLEKTLESPLDCKEIKPINPKRNQFWIFIGRTDVEAETATLWSHDAKNWLIGKDWCWERLKAGEGMTEDEMVAWHHWLEWWTSSGSWWWTGKSVVLQSMGLQRVGHDQATELTNW